MEKFWYLQFLKKFGLSFYLLEVKKFCKNKRSVIRETEKKYS